jgi:apolipoprotein N-acyltransferase
MAVTRGIENGFTIARSAQEGLITFSDSYGRILGEQSSATDPMMVQRIPPGPGATFYTRYGDWFGWATVVMLCGLFGRFIDFQPMPTTAGVSRIMHQ